MRPHHRLVHSVILLERSPQGKPIELNQTTHPPRHPSIMEENGVLAWLPHGTKGVRVPGWVNQVKNMPEDETSDYATLNVYILDDIDPGAVVGAQGTAAQLKHAQWCNNLRDTFYDAVADSRVHGIRMQHGQRPRDVLERIEEVLQDKTADDLVVFCFQGTAGDDGDRYTL